MNGAKIYHSNFGDLETIKLGHTLFPRSFMADTLQFKRDPSSSFNSKFSVYYEVKQSANYEFFKKPYARFCND